MKYLVLLCFTFSCFLRDPKPITVKEEYWKNIAVSDEEKKSLDAKEQSIIAKNKKVKTNRAVLEVLKQCGNVSKSRLEKLEREETYFDELEKLNRVQGFLEKEKENLKDRNTAVKLSEQEKKRIAFLNQKYTKETACTDFLEAEMGVEIATREKIRSEIGKREQAKLRISKMHPDYIDENEYETQLSESKKRFQKTNLACTEEKEKLEKLEQTFKLEEKDECVPLTYTF